MSGCIVPRRVDRYDGTSICVEGKCVYEVGSYLGSGTAGVVHEVYDVVNEKVGHLICCNLLQLPSCVFYDLFQYHAIKIVNPIGFKLLPQHSLQRFVVAVKVSTPCKLPCKFSLNC